MTNYIRSLARLPRLGAGINLTHSGLNTRLGCVSKKASKKLMQTFDIYEAKTRLNELLKRVQRGERLTITNRGVAVADLIPSASGERSRVAEAIATIKSLRSKSTARVSAAELKSFRETGRR
jgi:prevent-host-death family protein